MTKQAKILWMDLEMTGLNPIEDRILEVAIIATDWDFNEIASYTAVVKVDPGLMNKRMEVSLDFWTANPEALKALTIQNDSGKSSQEVENEIIALINDNFDSTKAVLLAGNSIHQDRRFISNHWKILDSKLHYRMLDVTSWKVVFEGKYSKKFAKPNQHRALDDIRGSIMELKYYLAKIK